MDQEVLANFVGITGASEDAARRFLEMCDNNFGNAVELWFSDEELQRNLSNATPSAPAASTSTSTAGHGALGREDTSGVIHIDSDDEDMPDDVAGVARTAQEEEDAAVARRLQEELYQSHSADEAGVRAPMGRTTETLVAPSGSWGPDEDMNDMSAAIQEQLSRRRQAARLRNNPFSQSIWEDPESSALPAFGSASGVAQSDRARRLADLFRPPREIMSHLSWDEAREEGKHEKKWILVNLQDMTDFKCQALNRDIWKDEAIQQLINESFIFLQYSKDDPRADQYITFYMPNNMHENQSNYPHVSIVDPRTGERVKVWSGVPFPTALEFHAKLAEFLDRYSLEANSKNPVARSKRPERVVDVDRMTEEEMLEMAMQNSLETDGHQKPSVYDPDELTRLSEAAGDKGKGKAEAEPEPEPKPEPEAAEESVFARIPADRPHTEPENNPATTTRIQFRHPNGRVIRRFNLDDTVSRIYEWLKAEPLEGKEGVEFELKVMPQGWDLIEELGKSVADTGLKQGTVMIEFIED